MTAPTVRPVPAAAPPRRFSSTSESRTCDAASNDAFEPSKYRDTVRDRVMETIQRKVDGQDITTDVAVDGGSKVLDLMEALKASLASVQKGEEAKVKVS